MVGRLRGRKGALARKVGLNPRQELSVFSIQYRCTSQISAGEWRALLYSPQLFSHTQLAPKCGFFEKSHIYCIFRQKFTFSLYEGLLASFGHFQGVFGAPSGSSAISWCRSSTQPWDLLRTAGIPFLGSTWVSGLWRFCQIRSSENLLIRQQLVFKGPCGKDTHPLALKLRSDLPFYTSRRVWAGWMHCFFIPCLPRALFGPPLHFKNQKIENLHFFEKKITIWLYGCADSIAACSGGRWWQETHPQR